jgi:hypothetical protein
MIWGKPDIIDNKKLELYKSYAQHKSDESESRSMRSDRSKKKQVEEPEPTFEVERLVAEFATVKQVLINNAIPVSLAEIESGGVEHGADQHTKGWGTRVLFDKKLFLSLLTELENMRKVLQVKKMHYIFNTAYEGKP